MAPQKNTAELLYGETTPSTTTPSSLLSGATPAKPQVEDPNAAIAAVLYQPDAYAAFPSGLREAFKARTDDHAVVLGRTSAEQLRYDRAFADAARSSGFNDDLAGRIYNAAIDADLADLHEEPVNEAQVRQDAEDTRRAVFDVYGQDAGERWLKVADDYVTRHPKLAAILARRGIGSRKDIVIPILEHARRRYIFPENR
jgi:hypothetical protein